MTKGTGKGRNSRRTILLIAAALAVCAAAAAGLLLRPGAQPPEGAGAVRVELDGIPWNTESASLPETGGLRVYITLDGKPLLDLPFEEKHTVRVQQPDGGENTVTLTGEAVMMTKANCEGQDCVEMGEVTRDNLETRVMGGFIICLPHRLSVEVRSRD